ncbi:hypothetical protein HYU94_00015 [Candidatus Daviesbacteria bacterium]|nr:hypothetical protein [Candidatus Daviesbacteria bacterium]
MSENLTQNGSLHQVARVIRETTLDLLEFGATGSDSPVPNSAETKAVKLPALLRLSPYIMRHYQVFSDILNAPRQFQITKQPNGGWNGEKPHGDVIYHKEECGDFYTFPHQLTSPHLNPSKAALEIINGGDSYHSTTIHRLSGKRHLIFPLAEAIFKKVGITADKEFNRATFQILFPFKTDHAVAGIWNVNYCFTVLGGATVYDPDYLERFWEQTKMEINWQHNVARRGLLSFYYTPRAIDGQTLVNLTTLESKRRFYRVLDMEKAGPYNAFEVFPVHFDGEAAANDLARKDKPSRDPHNTYSEYADERFILHKIGSRNLNFLKLGIKGIAGQTYHIYTLSEEPLVSEKSHQGSYVPQLKLSFSSVYR